MSVASLSRWPIATLAAFVLAGCSSKSNTETGGSSGAPRDAVTADAASASGTDAGGSGSANDLDATMNSIVADPFESDPFDATSLSGTTLRDGKLVDLATLSPKIIFRACPLDVASGSLVYVVHGDPPHRLLEMSLGPELRPRQRVKLFAEDDTHEHHGPRYATVDLPDRTEARKGYVFARVYSKSRVDIEFDADFGPKGHIKGRFESGPPRHSNPSFGVGVKCGLD